MALYFESFSKMVSTCGPDARFLLEVIIAGPEHSYEQWQDLSVKLLAKHLRLDESVISAALSELVAAAVLKRCVAPRDGLKGRGRVTYGLCLGDDPKLMDRAYPQHAELLQVLFSGADMVFAVLGSEQGRTGELGDSRKSEEFSDEASIAKPTKGKHQLLGGRGRLSIRNRLLFAVLLSRSDRFGEAQVGLPELAKLTGMQSEQVKNRLARLMMLGLIRRHISGLSSKIFDSGRIESTYFLNIDAVARQGAIAVHITHDIEGKRFTHADVLLGDSRNAAQGQRSGIETPVSLLRLLAGQPPKVFFLLQHLLCRYASHLLSRHWQKLASEKQIEDAELRAWIEKDFIKAPKSAQARKVDIEPEAGICGEAASHLRDSMGREAKEACAHIYVCAMEIARDYRARFGQANWVDFEAAHIRILPIMSDIGYRAITILFQPTLVGLGRFSVLREVGRGMADIGPQANETEFDLQRRLDFGLVCLPRNVRKALGLQ